MVRPEPFVEIDDVNDCFHIAIAVIAVDKDRQVACRHNVANTRSDLSEPQEPAVWNTEASADERKSADKVRLEAGALNEASANRIMSSGKHQGTFARDDPMRTCADTAHSSLIAVVDTL